MIVQKPRRKNMNGSTLCTCGHPRNMHLKAVISGKRGQKGCCEVVPSEGVCACKVFALS